MSADFVERNRRGEDERHGTPGGALRHSRRGEDPCDACRAAKSEYDRRWRAAGDTARRSRANAKAQQLALRDLKAAHEDEYRAAYLKHKAAVFAERGLAASP